MSERATACKQTRGGAAPDDRSPLLDPATPSGAALRTTVAAVIAMALAFALHVEVPALAVVFVLARGNAGALTMLAGAIAGSALAIVLLALFDQSRVAFSLALFAATGLATHAALGRRFPYAYVQGLLSCLIVVGQSLDAPDGAEVHAFYGIANVAIAAGAAFLAGASQPVMVAAQLQNALASHLRSCSDLLRANGAAATSALVLRLALSSRRLHVLLAASWPTRQVTSARRRALAAAVAQADTLLRHVLALDGWARHVLALDGWARRAPTATAAPEPRVLAGWIDEVAPLLGARRGALPRDWHEQLRCARLLATRALIPEPHEDPADASLPATIVRSARGVLAALARWAPFLRPGVPPEPPPAEPRAQPWRGQPANRFRIRHAAKAAASYLLVLWAWVAADWGAIVPAVVVSVLVATLATPLGATLRKALLRVGGVLGGGIAGLLVAVVLLPWVTTLPAICTVAGLVLLGFLWIQQHSERLVFAALQAAIAFTLTLVHGTGPSPTWREPLDSLIGLAFGIIVVVAVMHAVWPIDATSSARALLADLLRSHARRVRALASLNGQERAAPRRDEDDARAQSAREVAAGFVHEVELYGAQLGRPAEDLAGALRAMLELDALLVVTADEAARGRWTSSSAHERSTRELMVLLERACHAVALELDTPELRPADDATERLLRELAQHASGLACAVAPGATGSVAFAQAMSLAAALLVEVHDSSRAA